MIMHDVAFGGRDHAGVRVLLQLRDDDARDDAPDPGRSPPIRCSVAFTVTVTFEPAVWLLALPV